jgi:hypothetical protein
MKEISRSRWHYVAQQMNPGDAKPYPAKWDNIEFLSVLL